MKAFCLAAGLPVGHLKLGDIAGKRSGGCGPQSAIESKAFGTHGTWRLAGSLSEDRYSPVCLPAALPVATAIVLPSQSLTLSLPHAGAVACLMLQSELPPWHRAHGSGSSNCAICAMADLAVPLLLPLL